MLRIVAKRTLIEGVLEKYTALVQELADQTRQEPGCIEYTLYVNRGQNVAAIIETWESQEYLDAHLKVVEAAGYRERLNAYADPGQPVQVEKYEYVY
ncbi:putative quinol monooxygenase [Paenibacillus sp. S150]|uniref:putative quinol monooxygenase n=1 Tax=Paenibacillus sp. S150 TaxID=2749826 RepID=UPI001C597BF5|nr:antibiotic biosynthesis monooxygenase family protein [Paenibacillus sp. S150]MBW4081215.1 antibiotic biosynthesis monooxygenase [Paenibacillus sp. S150]